MSEDEVITELRVHIARNHMTSFRYAASIGVTPSFISKVLRKQKPVTKQILDSIGLEKKVTYIIKAA